MFSFQRQNKRTSKGSQKNVFKEGKNDNKMTYNLMLNSFVDECVQGNENKKVDMKKKKKKLIFVPGKICHLAYTV